MCQYCNWYRITPNLKVETDIIANISANPIGRAGIFEIVSVETFRTDFNVFIGDVIMCSTPDWLINLRMRVINWPNIFIDQGRFSDPDFISGTHQRENVKFDDNSKYFLYLDVVLLLVKEVTESKQSLLVKTVINLA